MIQRFEDQYPQTRVAPQLGRSGTLKSGSSSHNSGDDANGSTILGGIQPNGNNVDETAIDDEDTDNYAIRLSRSSSVTSLHARAMTSEEGQVHRLGQNLRRDFLSPSLDHTDDDPPFDESHVAALRDKLGRLHEEQLRSEYENPAPEKTFHDLGTTVEELWTIQRQDSEAFEKFKQSQIAAQINSGRRSLSAPDNKPEVEKSDPKSTS